MQKVNYIYFIVFLVAGLSIGYAANMLVTDSDISVQEHTLPVEEESFLYVQLSETGELTQEEDGSLELLLYSPNPKMHFFSDRPFRDAGDITFDEFVSEVFTKNTVSPNADLTYVDEDGNQQSYPVILDNPLSTNGDVSYDITFLEDISINELELKDVSLFIDSGSNYCTFYIDTSTNLSLNTDLTDPAYDYKVNWKKIEQTISSGLGSRGGETHYGWDHGENGGMESDLVYNVDGYDATFYLHTHCKTGVAIGKEVDTMSIVKQGQDSVLFELSSYKPAVGKMDRDIGVYEIQQQTGFWMSITDESAPQPITTFGLPGTLYVNLGDGNDSFLQTAGPFMPISDVKSGKRSLQVCDFNNENCRTTTIHIDTTAADVVACNYKSGVHLQCDVLKDLP